MELLPVAAAMMALVAVRQRVGESIKGSTPVGERDREKSFAGDLDYMDRNTFLDDEDGHRVFPQSRYDPRIYTNDQSTVLNEPYQRMFQQPEFQQAYADNFRETHDEEHNLFRVERMRYPYNTFHQKVRWIGSEDDRSFFP